MKKTLKRSMSIFLSVLMVFSVLSSGMFSASALTQVVISNCDSADGWVCYPGDGLELTTTKKTEGTGSIHTSQSGGFVQGTALPNLNLTGIQSITFDFAANTEEALSAPADVELYLFSGSGYQGFQELGEVDTTQALIFDSDAIRAGYGRDDMSFATITAGVKTVGESFNPSNVTGLLFWGCTAYDGSHEQWIDNIVATVDETVADQVLQDVISTIDTLPDAGAVTAADRTAILAAKSAYDALSETQKANVSNIGKLNAAIAALDALATFKEVVVNNCDSADGWDCYPGDGLVLDTDKKTEGTGSIHTIQSGGFVQGGPIANLDLTGIRSISFDFAANTAEALTGPADVAFYLFSGEDFVGYQELNEVDTSKVMAFDVDAIRAGYGKDDQSFATITTTPVSIGENFDITNVTGFMFWGCTAYSGDHEQWLDNVVAKVAVYESTDEEINAVIEAIAALPEASAVSFDDKAAVDAAYAAYERLSDGGKAAVTNIDKLNEVKAALDALFAAAKKIGIKTDWIYTTFYGDTCAFDAEEGKTYTVKAKINATPGETDERYIAKLQLVSADDVQSTSFMLSDYNALPEETDAKYGYKYKTLSAELTPAAAANYRAAFVYGGKKGDLHNASVITYAVEVYDGDNLIASFCPADDGIELVEDEVGPYWSYVYGVADESKLSIALTGSEVNPGAAVNIPFTVAGGEVSKNIATFHAVVNYDSSVLTPVEGNGFFTASEILSESMIVVNTNTDEVGAGKAEIAVLNADAIGMGQWGTLNFTVAGDAAVGTVTEVSMTACEDIATSDLTLITNVQVDAAELTVVKAETPADDVIALINAIGTPITLDSEAKIVAARQAYELLDEAEKANVTNYEVLTAAEAALASLKSVKAVEDLIAAIGEIEEPVSKDNRDKTAAARTAYDELTEDEQATVSNYDVLTAAEAAIEAYDARMTKVQNAIDAIAAIGEIGDPVTEANRQAVANAEAKVALVDEGDRDQITNADVLAAAKAAIEAYDARMQKVQDAIDAIDAIGEIGEPVTQENRDAVAAAEAKVALVDEGDRDQITNADVLAAAKAAIEAYDARMQKVQDAIDAIDAIGEIGEPVTQENREAVATAEAKLALVDSKDTDKVTNADKLDAAKAAIEAYDARMQKVQDAIDAIDAIGEIGEPVTQENRDAVATAEAKLALVDSKDTDKVTNTDKLDAAKAAIAAYDARMQKVQDAIDAIDAIGEIGEPVTQENRDAVATAEAKLALVDSKDTDKVTNADKLDAAKAAIAAYDARMQKVQDAIDAIDAIGTIEDPVTDENRQAVADAEAKVALVDEGDRDLITNADVLEAAKAAIAKNDKRAQDVAAVTEMINTLPEIKYPLTEDMRTAIAAAKTAYGELDEIGKGRVENYTVLEEAEELVQLFDNLGNVDNEGVVTASDAQFVMQFVVKSAQLSDWQKQVADVNNDGKVNSIDALLILRYSKGMITEFPYNS